MGLPETEGPAKLYYNAQQSEKYARNSRIVYIQQKLAQRCVDLLEMNGNGLILDIGCGSGLSGYVLKDNGYQWIGVDVSMEMLKLIRDESGGLDYVLMDMGEGLHFLPGTFDGAVSVSAIQWLFYSHDSSSHPVHRIRKFFTTLYSICKPNAKCALQFYLKNKKHIEILKCEAIRAGFNGGIQIDGDGTRNVKNFLVLVSTARKEGPRKSARRARTADAALRRGKNGNTPIHTKHSGRKRPKR